MLKKKSIIIFSLIVVLCFFIGTCFARSIINGRVIDAETGKPVANAVFYIGWYRETGLPGLTSAKNVETAEGYTDADGYFKVPKYSTFINHYRMAVYKKGYTCWTSDKIFPTWEERNDFKPKNKMVIKLEKLKEEYSKEDHARFTVFAPIGACPSRVFNDAVRGESDLLLGIYHPGREDQKKQEMEKQNNKQKTIKSINEIEPIIITIKPGNPDKGVKPGASREIEGTK